MSVIAQSRATGKTSELVRRFLTLSEHTPTWFVVSTSVERAHLIRNHRIPDKLQHRIVVAHADVLRCTSGFVLFDNVDIFLAGYLGARVNVATVNV